MALPCLVVIPSCQDFFCISKVGKQFFLILSDFVTVVRRFVVGCRDLEDLEEFQGVQRFSVDSEHPLGLILASNREL